MCVQSVRAEFTAADSHLQRVECWDKREMEIGAGIKTTDLGGQRHRAEEKTRESARAKFYLIWI